MRETTSWLPASRGRAIALVALSVLFVAAGANHFVNPAFYVSIMPPYLPAPLALVYLSGALEILGGVAAAIPRLRAAAGWFLVLLLIAIFPANMHMALHPDLYPSIPPALLWARLPLQAVFIGWAYWATRPES